MRAAVVALWDENIDEYLEEMKELIRTLGGECCVTMTQNREKRDPAYYVGSGKIDELKNAVGKVPVIVWFILIVLVLMLIARQIEKKRNKKKEGEGEA